MLSMLNFQGATKRSKPDIYPGDIVVAKILDTTQDSGEPFLTCVNLRTGKSDGLGVLTGGGSTTRPGILSGMVAATTVVETAGLAKNLEKRPIKRREQQKK